MSKLLLPLLSEKPSCWPWQMLTRPREGAPKAAERISIDWFYWRILSSVWRLPSESSHPQVLEEWTPWQLCRLIFDVFYPQATRSFEVSRGRLQRYQLRMLAASSRCCCCKDKSFFSKGAWSSEVSRGRLQRHYRGTFTTISRSRGKSCFAKGRP